MKFYAIILNIYFTILHLLSPEKKIRIHEIY